MTEENCVKSIFLTEYIRRELNEIFNLHTDIKEFPASEDTLSLDIHWAHTCLATHKEIWEVNDKIYDALKKAGVWTVMSMGSMTAHVYCKMPANMKELETIMTLIKLQK